jgi:hypothetical protein
MDTHYHVFDIDDVPSRAPCACLSKQEQIYVLVDQLLPLLFAMGSRPRELLDLD